MFGVTLNYTPDQKVVTDWVKESQLTSRNVQIGRLHAVNKDGGAIWLQLFDVNNTGVYLIDDTDKTSGVIQTETPHGYSHGDEVALTDIESLTTGFVRVISATTFKLYSTYAQALAGGATGLLLPDDDGDTGSVTKVKPEPREYPIAASSDITIEIARFVNGIYARAVTAADGSTLIADADLKIDLDYMHGTQAA